MYRAGHLPGRQLPTGTILLSEPEKKPGRAVVYARVSSADQRPDLDRQVGRVARWANDNGIVVSETICEVGSGLNGKRRKLLRALRDPGVSEIIVEHRDRLARFGSEYIEAVLNSRGAQFLVADSTELRDDLVRDMIDVLTSFCARLYGRRAAKNRAKKVLEAIQHEG